MLDVLALKLTNQSIEFKGNFIFKNHCRKESDPPWNDPEIQCRHLAILVDRDELPFKIQCRSMSDPTLSVNDFWS